MVNIIINKDTFAKSMEEHLVEKKNLLELKISLFIVTYLVNIQK